MKNKTKDTDEEIKALLIDVDFSTGKRAGGICIKNDDPNNPNEPKCDKGLMGKCWQCLDGDTKEIRIVEDGRDLKQYEGVRGVVVLKGKKAINEAIKKYIPVQYGISDIELVLAHLKEKGISLDIFMGKTRNEAAKELYDKKIAGIIKREPELL